MSVAEHLVHIYMIPAWLQWIGEKIKEFLGSGYQSNWELSKYIALNLSRSPDHMLQLR